jgi:hypothetical protein
MPENEFGHDRYQYVQGVRHRIGLLRTIRPRLDEDGPAFERRMDLMAMQLLQMSDVVDVLIDFQRKGGRIIEATIDVTLRPQPAQVPAAA